jgi:hypothetical protein
MERKAEKLDAVLPPSAGRARGGIGAHPEETSPGTQVIGCWPEFDVMLRCMQPARSDFRISRPGLRVRRRRRANAITLNLLAHRDRPYASPG